MNHDDLTNMTSPTANIRKSARIKTSEDSHDDAVISDRHLHNDMMKLSPKPKKSTASPLQSFMGNLMSSKKITSIVEDNARTSSMKQNFAISKAETRKGSERWESASAFLSDISPTPTFTGVAATSSRPKPTLISPASQPAPPIPSAELPFLSPPTRSASKVDALIFPTSPLETLESSLAQTSLRDTRTRSPDRSSAPRKPKRKNSTDNMSMSPTR